MLHKGLVLKDPGEGRTADECSCASASGRFVPVANCETNICGRKSTVSNRTATFVFCTYIRINRVTVRARS